MNGSVLDLVEPPTPALNWPAAVALLGWGAMSLTFVYLLIHTGHSASAAVEITLSVLSGVAVLVLPMTNRAVLRRISAATGGAVRGLLR